ncbi:MULTISPECIES: hypothetical protein [Burkholderia]|uniref:hypothetical protein n=2 Tax=Burkholderiaceae TaxID=119060 RepID=UPI001CF29E0D|nr:MULTISPECIES: hypothetical protein [Burkholderia]MCA3832900.1 hypothetical protein [Burkholderia sp.]MCA3924019.1 hypothetical protein [Burkholderia sp.]MCA8049798.1 hypothetical protein [Burkholderia arboris]
MMFHIRSHSDGDKHCRDAAWRVANNFVSVDLKAAVCSTPAQALNTSTTLAANARRFIVNAFSFHEVCNQFRGMVKFDVVPTMPHPAHGHALHCAGAWIDCISNVADAVDVRQFPIAVWAGEPERAITA